jgi:hypothetical protein
MKISLVKTIKMDKTQWFILAAIVGFAAGEFAPLRLGLSLQYDLLLPLLILTALLFIAWRLPRPWDEISSIAVTLLAFSTGLTVLWRMGSHGIYDVFGLLPWFDSAGYYSESLRLLDGGIFSQISARRPIFPAFFSTLMLLTGRNLRLSVSLVTLLAAVSVWLLAREIRRSEKNAALPAVVTVLLFFYYRKFNGAVLSDTLGFTLGVLSLVFLWNSVSRKNLPSALAGLFCLTMGESARPGAVFALPMLFLWIVFFFKSDESFWKRGLLAGVVLVAGILINTILTAVLAPGIAASYSNFANLIYSLVNGGTGWHAVYVDHPEFFVGNNEGYAAQQIYKVSWQIFLANPMNTVYACIHAVTALFSAAPYSAFNYLDSAATPREVTLASAPLEFILRWLANGLLIALLPAAVILRRNPKLTLLLALNLGVLFSLPFAAPWEVENMRAYAVSIAGMALAIGYVVLAVVNAIRKATPEKSTDSPRAGYTVTGLLVLYLLIPLAVRVTAHAPEVPAGQCPAGQERYVTRITNGSAVFIGKNTSGPYAIPYERYLKDLDQFPDATVGQGLKSVPEGSVIAQQNDALHGGNAYWLIGPENIMQPSSSQIVYCGHFKPISDSFQVFFAESVIAP